MTKKTYLEAPEAEALHFLPEGNFCVSGEFSATTDDLGETTDMDWDD